MRPLALHGIIHISDSTMTIEAHRDDTYVVNAPTYPRRHCVRKAQEEVGPIPVSELEMHHLPLTMMMDSSTMYMWYDISCSADMLTMGTRSDDLPSYP